MNTSVLERLWRVIEGRKKNPVEGSYTCKLLKDRKKLEAKILEESRELVSSKRRQGKDSVQWEAADLLYHLMVYLASKNVDLDDVMDELEGRMK